LTTEILSVPESDDIQSLSSELADHIPTEIKPESGHGQKPVGFDRNCWDPTIYPVGSGQDPTRFGRIRLESGHTCSSEFCNGDQMLSDSSESFQTLIYIFPKFFV
jgi:hypothetical protein